MDDQNKMNERRKRGWENMQMLLDQHMPEKSRTLIPWWYGWTGAAVIVIAVLGTLYFSPKKELPEFSTDTTELKSSDKTDLQNSKAPSDTKENLDKYSEEKTHIVSSPLTSPEIASLQPVSVSPAVPAKALSGYIAPAGKNLISRAVSEEKKPLPDDASFQRDFYAVRTAATDPLPPARDEIDVPSFALDDFIFAFTPEKSSRTTKIQMLGFAQSQWSFRDHFGFLQLGPGIRVSQKKWMFFLKGGLSLPIPLQQTFDHMNQDFRDRYYATGSTKIGEFTQDQINLNNQELVYYERYKPSPGFMVSTGAGRYITDRWSIAVEAGNTWFLYDYRQKTIPNQYLPLDSNVSNLKNNLISAGVKVGFHPNENLSFYAGTNHLNPFHSGQSSWMPVLQVQHTFF